MIKKQYTVGYFDEPVDVDDYVECNGEYLSSSEVVDRLNELVTKHNILTEENEWLKQKLKKRQNEEIQELYEEIDFLTRFIEKQGFRVKRGKNV